MRIKIIFVFVLRLSAAERLHDCRIDAISAVEIYIRLNLLCEPLLYG